jgi:hypothetical protein
LEGTELFLIYTYTSEGVLSNRPIARSRVTYGFNEAILNTVKFHEANVAAANVSRMDEVAWGLTHGESSGRTPGSLEVARRLAMRNIEAFVQTFSDQQALTAAASSWAPATLTQVAEAARIQEAGHLRCRLLSRILCIPFQSQIIICFKT